MGLGSGILRKLIPNPDSGVKRASYPGSGSVTLLAVYSKSHHPVEFQISACPALFCSGPSSFPCTKTQKVFQFHAQTCKIALA